jgi:hypothetical protein
MNFRIALLVLGLYYLRPQDWFPGMLGWNLMRPVALVGLIALATRPQGAGFGSLIKTPIDWAMLLYVGFIVITAPEPIDTLKAMLPLAVFYLLTAQGIQERGELVSYFKWWAGLLVALAGIGVAGLYGIDLTGSRGIYESMGERLAIGTYMHNNPNALGHSVITALPLAYALWFRDRDMGSRVVAVGMILLAGYCVVLTQSRGAFVVGVGATVLMVVFGKPKVVQVLVVAAAVVMGSTILAAMPRMGGGLRSDEGVQGRMLVWEQARQVVEAKNTGEGYRKFDGVIRWRQGNRTLYLRKATHGSYIQIGADLGKYGLFFYLLVLWCCLRTTLMKLPRDDEEEVLVRARACLFLLLAAGVASGWMIDRAYHMEYFLLAGACSAFYRQVVAGREREVKEGEASQKGEGEAEVSVGFGEDKMPKVVVVGGGEGKVARPPWRRIWLIDVAAAAAATWAVIWVWDWILKSFLY